MRSRSSSRFLRVLRQPAHILAGLGLLFALQAQAADCTPEVRVSEQVVQVQPGGSLLAQYVMTTGALCGWQIVALAVDNNDSLAAFANLSGWNAQVVTDNFWDSGIVLSRDDFGTGESYRFVTGTGPDGVGSFASYFGPFAELANIYWLSAHYGGPVVDHSTAYTATGEPIPLPADAFQFQTRAPASSAWAFLHNPLTGEGRLVTAVPEPGTALLWSLGLAGLLSARRRAGRSGAQAGC
jgi:hypothetical protein